MACRPEMGEHTWTRVGYQRALQGGDLCDCGKLPYVPPTWTRGRCENPHEDWVKRADKAWNELVKHGEVKGGD